MVLVADAADAGALSRAVPRNVTRSGWAFSSVGWLPPSAFEAGFGSNGLLEGTWLAADAALEFVAL